MRFHTGYFIKTIVVFTVEVFIALFVHDAIIRPYVGDVIAVAFVYYLLRTFLSCKAVYSALFALLFSFLVEYGQYAEFIYALGLQHQKWARIVLGTSFSWGDMLCYMIGFLILFVVDPALRKKH